MAENRRRDMVETRLAVSREARDALDVLAGSNKRKGELVNDLLLAAEARYRAIEAGTAPLDDFTQALLRAKYIREQRRGLSAEA